MKDKLLYSAIGGCIGAILTLTFSLFSPLNAENEPVDAAFSTITCSRLQIYKDASKQYGTPSIILEVDEHAPRIHLYGEGYSSRISMMFLDNSPFLTIRRPDSMNAHLNATGMTLSLGDTGDKDVVRIRSTFDDDGGAVIVRGTDTENGGSIRMTIDDHGGRIDAFGKGANTGAGCVALEIDEYGGRLNVYGKGSEVTRLAAGVNEYGNGVVTRWDKNGYSIR